MKMWNGYSERILPRTADISTCISTRILWRQGIYIFVTGRSRNVNEYVADYSVFLCRHFMSNRINNHGPLLYVKTNLDAPQHRVVTVHLSKEEIEIRYSRGEECEARSSQQWVFCCHMHAWCNPNSFLILILSSPRRVFSLLVWHRNLLAPDP